MLKNGIFKCDDVLYEIYEVDEPGFYRIDFVREGTRFQVDVANVVYSQVNARTTKVYGDAGIYTRYLNVLTMAGNVQLKREVSERWEDGAFIVHETGTNEKLSCYVETTSKNGIMHSFTYKIRDSIVTMGVVQEEYGVKIEPMNFKDYKHVTVGRDTVDTSDTDPNPYYSLEILQRRYNLGHIEEKDYVVVQSEGELRNRLKHWVDSPVQFKSCDTETTGVDVDMYGDDELVGIILSEDINTSTYYPVRHKLFWNMSKVLLDEVMKAIISQCGKLVGANIKFDRKVFLKEGYDVTFKWDTMQLSIIEHPYLEKGVHTLKQRATEANGNFYLELSQIFINKSDIDFSVLPIDIVKYYACPDGTNTLEVFFMLMEKIPRFQWKLAQLESYLANVKADMEYYGMRVNVHKYEEQYNNCNYIIRELLDAFRTLTKSDCNINSKVELSDLIYNKMHCEVLSRTSTGQPSTAALALKKLASEQRETKAERVADITDMYGNVIIDGGDLSASKHPALVVLSKYNEYIKLKTSFYARFERTMQTGRVFFWVNQNGAASGRQSSPMHQLPPELKALMLSDGNEWDMWGPDFSQIEIRMIAYLAGEKDLIDKCNDPDNDIHRVIGSLISGKEMWAITSEERSLGKRRNFGFVYLISGYGLARQIYNTPRPNKRQEQHAQEQLDALFHRFKYINRYIKQNAQFVQQKGFMETAWFNRRRYFKEIFDKDLEPRRKQSLLRMANNMPVQGTAADYLKLAEVKMFDYIREKGWSRLSEEGFPLVRLMLSIHDEILISAHQSILKEEIVAMIRACMETPVKGAPPFYVSPALMNDWEGHSDDSLAMPIRLRDKIADDFIKEGKRVFFQNSYTVSIPEYLKRLKSATQVDSLSESDMAAITFTLQGEKQLDADITMDDRRTVLINFIDFGAVNYVKTNYKTVLSNYRKSILKNYMCEMISRYGTNPSVLGANIRHPSLTHQLLDVYKKRISKMGLTHEDAIAAAAGFYLEDLNDDSAREIKEPLIADERKDKSTEYSPLETLVNLNESGEVVYDGESGTAEDEFTEYTDAELDLSSYRLQEKIPYVWELADAILFDVQDVKSQDDVNKVLAYIYKNKESDGFFRTYLIWDGKTIDTTMRMENIDMREANEIIYELLEKQNSNGG